MFINVYLPNLESTGNSLKIAIFYNKNLNNNYRFYRINYSFFPYISELDVIYEDYEQIFDLIFNYKFQLDLYFVKSINFCGSFESFIRMFKLPFYCKLKYSYLGVS
jgi:hypothetical protein